MLLCPADWHGKGLSLAVRVQSGMSKLGRGLPGEYLPVPTLCTLRYVIETPNEGRQIY
jgi:hypothetical protein